ncbi:hypothetical protein D9611_008720 [Ephemerocybe angulata]|uniref:Uncharacterized protein n=1 Tax=Ephemerocybe angulata TaxID=980116 RepID=A0A8H5CC08_9AGAR|nr:hypothetical protein D9611_008720 [Tulosesus angulatus]
MGTDIDVLLTELRDNPADNASATESVLEIVFNHLTSVQEDTDGRLHWFCDQASPRTVASASFLLRLYGFNGDSVNRWKAGFHKCVATCCSCVQQLGEIKLSSRSTYFGAYGAEILQRFFEKFEEWELDLVLQDLKAAGFSPDDMVTDGKTLSDVPSTLLYRMVATWRVFRDSRIQALFHNYTPTRTLFDWPPKRPPPPGILLLLMGKSQAVRDWARKQCLSSELALMSSGQFTESYAQALLTMAAVVNSPTYTSTEGLLLSDDPAVVWSAFGTMLRVVPVEKLMSSTAQSIDLRHIVTGHLHDTGSHFIDVLRSFHLLLKRLSKSFWLNDKAEYPKVVFDSIKDNASFSAILQEVHLPGERQWTLTWMPELLSTLQEESIYGEVLAKMADFLCEELQHERFDEARPIIMNSAISLLSSVLRKCDAEKDFRHKDALFNTLDIHSGAIVSVAFGRDHDAEPWKTARASARTMIRILLQADIQKILTTITTSVKSLYQVKKGDDPDPIPLLSIRKQLWTSVYSAIDSKDIAGLAVVITAVGKGAYLTKLLKEPYKGIEKVRAGGPGTVAGDKVIDQINDALQSVQSGLLDAVSRFANYSVSTSALEVLRQPGVGKSIILLLLSPVQDFQTAAQTLIGLAFDEDVRSDCFRAMFENMPDATFDGISDFLSQFNTYASQTPEAAAVSRSLVRCFNDIIDVLCSSPDGLLLKDAFLRPGDITGPASRLLQFWKSLTTALTTIFKRTSVWALYYRSQEMVEWMRDAVILGRDTIKRWRVIENAANGQSQGKPTKQHSGVRTKMIECFQDMLPELSKWLRLTDEELLYQSFAILRNLLEVFKETETRPHDATLAKLTKYVADARADGKAKSRLDASSLVKLEDALAPFDESSSDDEVEITGHTLAPKKETKESASASTATKRDTGKEKGKKSVKAEEVPRRNFIQTGGKVKSGQLKLAPGVGRKISKSAARFSEADKAKLEQPAAFPTFKRSSTSTLSSASSSKPIIKPTTKTATTSHNKIEYKNEAALAADDETSSSSSSDSDSEAEAVPKPARPSIAGRTDIPQVRKQERRQIKTLDFPAGKSAMAERIRNHARPQYSSSLRLRPDISGLHKTILSWKYDHDGPMPPGNLQLNQVPTEFGDYTYYRRVFEPLLLLECWAQIVRSKEEVPPSYLAKVSSKEYVSDWLDFDLTLVDTPPRDWEPAPETDILLLVSPDKTRKIMAKTLSYRKNAMAMLLRARCLGGMDVGLIQGTDWQVSRIYSLSTINREYGALVAAPYLDCFQNILSSRLDRVPYIPPSEVDQAMTTLKLNKPQATAVVGAMKTDGFVLIQGPPGTGKTSTICGLVSRFISLRATPINAPEKQTTLVKPKILICAPSNAAIDEIAGRLISGTKKINVVRTGSDAQIGVNVKSASLDQLVRDKIKVKTGMQGLSLEDNDREIKTLLAEMDSLKAMREDKLKELASFKGAISQQAVLEQEAQKLRARRQELGNKLTALRDKIKSDNRSLDSLRRQMRREVLIEADVVCSTLSGSGHEALIDIEFEMVIVDEAAQSIELSSLIPMKYNSKRCVLVGDPQQLPPTVISQEATRRRYDQSLFLRLFNKNPGSVHLLSIQYRMHPDISRFPSQAFYEGRIEDGPNMSELTSREWHKQPMFGTYKFYNVAGIEEPGAFNSIKNTAEVQIAKAIYSRISREFKNVGFRGRIGIVSMYRAQIQELKRQFFQAFGQSILESVDFNTVDGFQGQEKDIIILSCVRAGPGLRSIGFLSDVRRLNVAITRAKSSLFILGNSATLERSDETWRKVVSDARERGRLVNVDTSYFTQSFSAVSGVTLSPAKKKTTASASEPLSEKKPRLAPALSQLPQAVPTDLVTPQELKKLARKPSTHGDAAPSSSALPPRPLGSMEPPKHVAGVKRAAEDDGRTGPSKQAHNGNANGNGPRQPLPKKPKQPSLFIPKKSKK